MNLTTAIEVCRQSGFIVLSTGDAVYLTMMAVLVILLIGLMIGPLMNEVME